MKHLYRFRVSSVRIYPNLVQFYCGAALRRAAGLGLLAAVALSLSGCLASLTLQPSSYTLVILGSSTAAGEGATPITDGWAYLYTDYAVALNPKIQVVNLAISGYTTYHILPTGTVAPSNRPTADPAHNITAALALAPAAIVINLPINDTASGFTDAETIGNYNIVTAAAASAGVPLWVTTTRPANYAPAQIAQLERIRDWTYTTYGNRAIDDWTTFANADGTLNPLYAAADDFHFNNAGHSLLYQRVVAANILQSVGLAR